MQCLPYLSLGWWLLHHAFRITLFLPATIPRITSVHATDTDVGSQLDEDSCAETASVAAYPLAYQSVLNTREWPITNFVPLCKPPKYFAIDIDGTFRATDPEAMKRNLDALEKALKAGYNVFFCTGRGLWRALHIIPEDVRNRIGFTGYPGVYQNGAVVYGHDGQILQYSHFPVDIISSIVDCIQAAKHEKYSVFASKDEWYLLTEETEYFDTIYNSTGLKVPLVISNLENLKTAEISIIFIFKYGDVANNIKDLNDNTNVVIKISNKNKAEITHRGITKGSGLNVLLSELNIEASDCGYVGDRDNDIEAMQMVEHSFAVGNAKDAVKTAAKYVVEQTNEEAAFTTVMNAVYGINED